MVKLISMAKTVKVAKNTLNRTILKQIDQTINSIFKYNAPSSMGYLFNTDEIGKDIDRGMFCDGAREINNSWEYFYRFLDGCIYKILPA